MRVLLDTNILMRLVDKASAEHEVCVNAIQKLNDEGNDLLVCAQVLIEFWSAATRPKEANGMGMAAASAREWLEELLKSMELVSELPDIGIRWLDLVSKHAVISKQAHDARLVAFATGHKVDFLLTLNLKDFSRFHSELRCKSPVGI